MMAIHRLHNENWGIQTNCFVCEPTNDHGLKIPFWHDDEREVVTAEFELATDFSGAPTLVHGGVTLAVLDEAMAWACIAIGEQWAVTTETTTTFHRPVRVDRRYRVDACVVDHVDGMMHTRAEVIGERGEIRAEAEAGFTTLGAAQVTRLSGLEVGAANRRFVND